MKQLPCQKSTSSTRSWELEKKAESSTKVKSGDLYLLSSGDITRTNPSLGRRRASRHPVHVKVYRSSFDHYAVLTAGLRAPATYLNLRTCNCGPWGGFTPSSSASPPVAGSASRVISFRVELGGGEGQVMYFEVNAKDQGGVEEWVRAFQGVGVLSPGTISPSLSPVIPRNPIMPMLQESMEEEEEEISGLD